MAATDNVSKSGDDTNKHTDIGSYSVLNLSFGDTLYLHPNDTGGSPIVTIKLTGTENYKMWSIAMTFALRNHNKLGFIDDLKETYDKVDGSAVFNLHKNINSLTQNGASFLMGLNESYLAIKSNILTREPLPLVKAAFVVVSGEASHRNATFIRATKPTATTFVAKTFDNKRSYVKKNFNANTRHVASNNASASADVHSTNVSSNNATTSNSHGYFSNEQLARLMSLLNDNGVSTTNANMAEALLA
ncbi:ribonuclease H-like domain-containing protein [Tanacetum coccineum]